jgi:hypothetical protein
MANEAGMLLILKVKLISGSISESAPAREAMLDAVDKPDSGQMSPLPVAAVGKEGRK